MKTIAHLFSRNLCHRAFTQAAVTVGKTCHSHPHTPGSLHQANSRWLKSNTTLSEAFPTDPTPTMHAQSLSPWGSHSSPLRGQMKHLLGSMAIISHRCPCFRSLPIGVGHVPAPCTCRGQAMYKTDLVHLVSVQLHSPRGVARTQDFFLRTFPGAAVSNTLEQYNACVAMLKDGQTDGQTEINLSFQLWHPGLITTYGKVTYPFVSPGF